MESQGSVILEVLLRNPLAGLLLLGKLPSAAVRLAALHLTQAPAG
jgi:hypothetical protein